jgi:lysozyme
LLWRNSAFNPSLEKTRRCPIPEEFDSAFGVSRRFDRPLWLRSLVVEPHFGARPWRLWQVSNFRRLDGIDGRVDWNVLR